MCEILQHTPQKLLPMEVCMEFYSLEICMCGVLPTDRTEVASPGVEYT